MFVITCEKQLKVMASEKELCRISCFEWTGKVA